MMRARVFVTLKPSVFDPQGKTIVDALHSLGYGGVEDVRQGKYFELELAADSSDKAAIDGIRGRRQAAGESGDRELQQCRNCEHRGCRTVRGSRYHSSFPDPTATTTRTTRRRTCSARRRSSSGTRRRIFGGADAVILPGGFSHGDYLRTGAIARFSPVMDAVRKFAADGGPVLGICNGFQILLEAGLLPGRDASQSRPEVPLRARARPRRADRHAIHAGVPPAAGSPHPDCPRRRQLLHARRRAARSSSRIGRSSSVTSMPAGASPTMPIPTARSQSIAGICNERRNVVGLMPHPERACELAVGSADGLVHVRVGRQGACSRRSDGGGERIGMTESQRHDKAVLERHGLNDGGIRAHRARRSAASRA